MSSFGCSGRRACGVLAASRRRAIASRRRHPTTSRAGPEVTKEKPSQDIAFTTGARPATCSTREAGRSAHAEAARTRQNRPGPAASHSPGWTRARPEPDRSGPAQLEHLQRGGRPDRALAIRPSNGSSSSAPPRAASGSTTPQRDVVAEDRRPGSLRSARSRSRRRTTRSSTPAPAKAPSPATACTATGSSSRPTAAPTGPTSRATSFEGVSVSGLVVDPTNPNHLYAAILRGRGGARRTTPADTRATASGSRGRRRHLELLKEARRNKRRNRHRDRSAEPRRLYASFWGDAIYKSTDGGKHWSPMMTGLPSNADYAAGSTRFSIAARIRRLRAGSALRRGSTTSTRPARTMRPGSGSRRTPVRAGRSRRPAPGSTRSRTTAARSASTTT